MNPDSSNPGLWQYFQMGGWAMWLIFAFGLVAVGAAGRFAWRGEHQLAAFIRWLVLTVLSCGLLGFVAGMIRGAAYIVRHVAADRQVTVLIEAIGEALNNVAAAMMFSVVVCLLTAIAYRRFPLPNPSATPR